MKQWILYTVLFCIGFLNVPRSLVHDCDTHASHTDNHTHVSIDQQDYEGAVVEQDDCHLCEFQLDFFEVPNVLFGEQQKARYFVLAPESLGIAQLASERTYDLRGPPVSIC